MLYVRRGLITGVSSGFGPMVDLTAMIVAALKFLHPGSAGCREGGGWVQS